MSQTHKQTEAREVKRTRNNFMQNEVGSRPLDTPLPRCPFYDIVVFILCRHAPRDITGNRPYSAISLGRMWPVKVRTAEGGIQPSKLIKFLYHTP